MDKIAVFFLTKETPGREGIARRTIEAIKKNLLYDGSLTWIIAYGGGSTIHQNEIGGALAGSVVSVIKDGKSVGANWNITLKEVFREHTIYLRLEDDMVLKDKLDITPYVKLLEEREDVGMVRLGLMPIGLDLHSVAHDGRIYFDIQKSTQYFYSGNPGLIHKRMHDAYEYFSEDTNPGQIEVDFDHVARNTEGPRIWWPLDLGGYEYTYGYFNHVAAVKSY